MGAADAKQTHLEGLLNFEAIEAIEARRIWARRNRKTAAEAPPQPIIEDKVGVGLSGGGVRSASFCLGALQALNTFKVIPKIDYLSTVSGGGYTGASMIAHMSENDGEFPFDESSFEDSPTVRHIRNNSRYLFPKGTTDILRSVGILTRGLLVNLVLTLTLVLPLAALTILANPSVYHLEHSFAGDIWRLFGLPGTGWLYEFVQGRVFFTQVMLAGLAAVGILWAIYRSALEEGNARSLLGKPEFLSRWAGAWAFFMPLLIFTFVAEFQTLIIEWIIRFYIQTDGFEFSAILSTIAGAAGFSTLLTVFRGSLVNTVAKALDTPNLSSIVKAITAKAILYVGALVLPLMIYAVYLLIAASGIDFAGRCPSNPALAWLADNLHWNFDSFCRTLMPAPGQFPLMPEMMSWQPLYLMAVFFVTLAIAIGYSGYWRNKGEPEAGTWTRLVYKFRRSRRDRMPLYGLLILSVLTILVAIAVRKGLDIRYWNLLWNYVWVSGIFIAIGVCFSENANALHGLYRDRLNAAFRLGRNVNPRATLTLAKIDSDKTPYLLVNAVLNARHSREETEPVKTAAMWNVGNPRANLPSHEEATDPAQRGRNAEFFLFTSDYIGSDSTLYAPTVLAARHTGRLEDNDIGIDLATAVAISGAAISSNSGRVLSGVLSPTLALLNARLGYWLDNPKYVFAGPGEIQQSWFEVFRLYLVQEAFGLLRTDSKKVLLSDGGHIDNIGLYQLLRRKCKAIIIIDAEADPALNFGALADAQRFARIDFGHRVRIAWQPIREQSARRMRAFRGQATDDDRAVPADITQYDDSRHFAIGEIYYGSGQNEEDKGILLYIKANMTGDEPDYVTDYERRYPTFPHETTADQLFSEEQMEAYRALGFHSVSRALSHRHAPTSVEAETLMRKLREVVCVPESVVEPRR